MSTQRNPNSLANLQNGVKFTPENQPPPENKSAGILRKKAGKELAKAVLELAFKGMANSDLKQLAAAYFGIEDPEQVTVEMMLIFRQAEKAIQKADTAAFKAVMERAHGLPTQQITGPDDKDITIRVIHE